MRGSTQRTILLSRCGSAKLTRIGWYFLRYRSDDSNPYKGTGRVHRSPSSVWEREAALSVIRYMQRSSLTYCSVYIHTGASTHTNSELDSEGTESTDIRYRLEQSSPSLRYNTITRYVLVIANEAGRSIESDQYDRNPCDHRSISHLCRCRREWRCSRFRYWSSNEISFH